MSSFNDTRHIIHGATGGSNDDTTAYNDVLSNGSTLTFTAINGDQKSVSVSGGGTAVTAYNSVSVSGNDIVFGKTDGSTADTQPLGGLTAITNLQTLTNGHTNSISALEAENRGHLIPEVLMTTGNHTENGKLYSTQASSYHAGTGVLQGWQSFSKSDIVYWYTDPSTDPFTTANGSYFDYAGSSTLTTGYPGAWMLLALPDTKVISSFTIIGKSTVSTPTKFSILGKTTSNVWELLGTYVQEVETHALGTTFSVDNSSAGFGHEHIALAIVITQVKDIDGQSRAAIHYMEYHEMSPAAFYDATITGSNILNLISNSGTTSLTLPAGGTATSADAITLNFSVQTVGSSDKYFLNGEETPIIELLKGHKYIFTFPAAHPLKLSPSIDGGARDGTTGVSLGNAEYTTGVTYDSTTQLTFTNTQVSTYLLNNDLYYYCENHANMGGDGAIVDDNGINNITSITYDNSVPKLVIERAYHDIYGATPDDLALSDSYTSAALSGSDLTLNRISGTNATTITLPSGGGATSTTQHPTSAMTSNSLPSPLVAAASTEYNLFTDKLFGDDNLGNIGEYELNSVSYPIQVWGYDASDENVIIMAHEAVAPYHPQTQFVKITKSGNLVTGLGGNVNNTGKYVSGHINYTTLASLIAGYNAATHLSGNRTFVPHALFDLAVNESKAYQAFDEDAATQWVSHSNTYDVITGNALQTGFSGTPPTTFTVNGGYWQAVGLYYTKNTSDETNTFVRYELNVGATYGIEFSMNGSNELEFEVNDATHGTDNPGSFTINGGAAQTAPHVVAANDTIELFNTAANGGGSVGDFTVPSELAINVESKLASTTDVGEYLKIDLGSAMEAETLTLKSVAEYKEPRINMTAINQGDYEVTASSSDPGSPVYELFNSLTTPSTDYWVSDIGKYHISTGNYSASANLGTDFPSGGTTVDGEYVAITLQDKRKLLGYKLTKPDASTDDNSPKAFKLYARENSTSAWVLLTSESLTTAVGEYVSGDVNTGGTRFPSTGDLTPTTAYQTYALVFETIFTSGTSYSVWLSEFQLFCQPAEIENFKLYGSTDDATWTPIHDQSTSANITSSGTDFTITNPSSYQYYGLVVTKNGGYHNVSLGEMKLGVPQTVNLSEYYKLADWKTLIAGCADFAAFKTAVAAL